MPGHVLCHFVHHVNRVIFPDVVPACKLVDVSVQVLFGYVVEYSVISAPDHAPEGLHSVDMCLVSYVLAHAMHAANGACIGAASARRFGHVSSMRCPTHAVPPQKVISYGIHGHRENERQTGI